MHLAEHCNDPTFIKSMLLKLLTMSCMRARLSSMTQTLCHQLSQGKQVATPHDEWPPAGVMKMKHVQKAFCEKGMTCSPAACWHQWIHPACKTPSHCPDNVPE